MGNGTEGLTSVKYVGGAAFCNGTLEDNLQIFLMWLPKMQISSACKSMLETVKDGMCLRRRSFIGLLTEIVDSGGVSASPLPWTSSTQSSLSSPPVVVFGPSCGSRAWDASLLGACMLIQG